MLSKAKARLHGNLEPMRKRLSVLFILLISVGLLYPATALAFTASNTDNAGMHSSELEEKTTDDGNRQIVEYDHNGRLTYAADKHFARMVKTRSGSTLLEEYFDENGEPVEQPSGHYALLREYDDKNRDFKLTYLGANHKPMIISSGYSILIRSYNDQNQVEYEHYFDTDGASISNTSGFYGVHYKYENGRAVTVIYLDEKDGHIVHEKMPSGYSIVKRTFYEDEMNAGRIENTFYFDENEDPIALSTGQYGVHYDYDELGRVSVITYLGADGKATLTKLGYAAVKYTFNPDNTVDTEMYYDTDGNQTALSHGQYGVKYIDGKKVFLDQNGKEYFSLYNHISTSMLTDLIIVVLVVAISLVLSRRANLVLLAVYVGVIIYMTLMFRAKGNSGAQFELFWSYKQFLTSPDLRKEIINNILMFIPLGSILYKCFESKRSIIIAAILSILIEAAQYYTGYGLAEFDDVISNCLGAFIGLLAAVIVTRNKEKSLREISQEKKLRN